MKSLRTINLQLFDGAAGAGAPGATGAAAPETGGQVGTQPSASDRRSKRSGGLSNVVYGTQATQPTAEQPKADAVTNSSDAESKTATPSPEERRAAFDKLIGEDYKDLFTERTQAIIDRRFKETKGLEERLSKLTPAMQILMQRYNVDSEDKLVEAIDKDNSLWEEEAEKEGMSVERLKAIKAIERENAALKAEQQATAEEQRQAMLEQQRREQVAGWLNEAEALKETFPNLDLRTELRNPAFKRMVENGFPVEFAYKASHVDEIITGVAGEAAKQTEKSVVQNIQAKGARPSENGASPSGGVIVKNDVHSLSRKDREEIARRVRAGENISFGK